MYCSPGVGKYLAKRALKTTFFEEVLTAVKSVYTHKVNHLPL